MSDFKTPMKYRNKQMQHKKSKCSHFKFFSAADEFERHLTSTTATDVGGGSGRQGKSPNLSAETALVIVVVVAVVVVAVVVVVVIIIIISSSSVSSSSSCSSKRC